MPWLQVKGLNLDLQVPSLIGHLPSRQSQHTTNSMEGYLPGGRCDLQHSPKNWYSSSEKATPIDRKEGKNWNSDKPFSKK